MNDMDRYLDQACRQINGPDSLRRYLRKKLKEHWEVAIDALVAEGMSWDEACVKTIEQPADPEMMRDGRQSVYGPGVTSLFVERAIKWKDKRWHLAAQIGLALVIAMLPAVSYFLMVLVAPKVEEIYQRAGIELPVYYQGMTSIAVLLQRYFLGLILLLAVAEWLFESKCRSENKSLIRTVMFVGLSVISASGAFWMAYVYVFSLIHVAGELAMQAG